jgi:hypothetical protein
MSPRGTNPANQGHWSNIIRAVGQNPFGLAALALLIMLALLSLVAGAKLSADQRFWLFLAALVVLVAIVLVGVALSRSQGPDADEAERRLKLWFGRVATDMYWALDGVIENDANEETKAIAWATFVASVQREAAGEDKLGKRLREVLAKDILDTLALRHPKLYQNATAKIVAANAERAG